MHEKLSLKVVLHFTGQENQWDIKQAAFTALAMSDYSFIRERH